MKHGGHAPQVLRKAQERLLEMVDPALARLDSIIKKSKHDPSAVAAAKHILALNGMKATDKVDVNISYDSRKLALLSDDELKVFLDMARKLTASPTTIDAEAEDVSEEELSDSFLLSDQSTE